MTSPIDRITQAAISVFRRQGIEEARMEDIARLANISRPNLYRYVRDREDLIRLVVLQRASIISHELRIKTGAWYEQLTDLFVKVIKLAEKDKIFMLLVRQAGPAVTRLFAEDDDSIRTSLNQLVIPLLVLGREAKEIRDDLSDDEILYWLHYQAWSLVQVPELQKPLDMRTLARKFVIGAILKSEISLAMGKTKPKPLKSPLERKKKQVN